jgi:hypothetical protein
MDDKPRYPWRLATNERYRDVVKYLMSLATACLLLPGFFAREFLGVLPGVPLRSAVGWPTYWSWGFLSIAVIAGVVFHYLSAKWVRLAWGQEVDVLRVPVTDARIESALHVCFWTTAVAFLFGLLFAVIFVFGYGMPKP